MTAKIFVRRSRGILNYLLDSPSQCHRRGAHGCTQQTCSNCKHDLGQQHWRGAAFCRGSTLLPHPYPHLVHHFILSQPALLCCFFMLPRYAYFLHAAGTTDTCTSLCLQHLTGILASCRHECWLTAFSPTLLYVLPYRIACLHAHFSPHQLSSYIPTTGAYSWAVIFRAFYPAFPYHRLAGWHTGMLVSSFSFSLPYRQLCTLEWHDCIPMPTGLYYCSPTCHSYSAFFICAYSGTGTYSVPWFASCYFLLSACYALL